MRLSKKPFQFPNDQERSNEAAAQARTLTPRQGQIMHLVCEDLQDKEIGERLHCSRFTVRAHLVMIFQRLGVKGRVGAALAWERAVRSQSEQLFR